jgi:alcohol dehydrogenase
VVATADGQEPDLGPIVGGGASWEVDFGGYRLVFGAGRVDQVGQAMRELGSERVLLVTDRGLRGAGHVDRLRRSLVAAGAVVFVYDGVEENPTTGHVDEALRIGKAEGVDGIVGLGGGSALDCAKAANFLLTGGGRMEDYWGSGKARGPMLPSIGVPTTAGTGSEAQSYALISQDRTKIKMACGDKAAMFVHVVLDPELAATVPATVAAMAGIDAVSHAVESYVTNRRNALSAAYARHAWRLLSRSLPPVLARGATPAEWGEAMIGAHLAGAAIEQSMLGAAHSCANPLTARFDIPHGTAVGLMLPHVMRFNGERVGGLYDELATVDGTGVPLEQTVLELRRVSALPTTLRECGVTRESLAELAGAASRQWTVDFNPRPVSRQQFRALYEAAY